MRRLRSVECVTFVGVLIICSIAWADIGGLQRVASDLSNPVVITHAPGDPTRLFIAEIGGTIHVLDLGTGKVQTTPFLTVGDVSRLGEGGLLGMAFHPDYSQVGKPGFGKFYVSVTTGQPNLTSRIREFQVSATDPNRANPNSQREILSITRPDDSHNGGWIDFSPRDQYLYFASGDGGGVNDDGVGHTAETGNGQDITNNLFGKMLRIDVNGDDFPTDVLRNYAIPSSNPFKAGVGAAADDMGDDEIWAYGLRNPWRNSFDRATGDLWIGDVGQYAREEIDFQPASSVGGENYGWRLREGSIATPSGGVGGPPPAGNVDPVYEYGRDNDPFGGTVVTGGYVYRGPDSSLQGKYFFLDSHNSINPADDNYWMFDPANPGETVLNIDSLLAHDSGTPQFPVTFGEDAIGRLYISYLGTGDVYRITMAGDYDDDNDVDQADYELWRASVGTIGNGTHPAADGDHNNVVDINDYVVWRNNRGKRPGDYNADGTVAGSDYAVWRQQFGSAGAGLASDGNGNGTIDAADYTIWRNNNRVLLGDYDVDGDVDAGDYAVWRRTYGAAGAGLASDGNGNGTIDAADYVLWRNDVGDAMSSGNITTRGSTIPEPASQMLALVAAGLFVLFRPPARRAQATA